MTLFIALFFLLVSCSCRDWRLCSDAPHLLCRNVVYDYSGSLQQQLQDTQCTPALLELVYGSTLCHCAPFLSFFFLSGPLCFYLQHSLFLLSHPTLPRSTESRPRFHWPVSTFPLSHRRLVGSAHKERAANHRRPLINLGQCPRLSYLHSDVASQSGVGTGEDFDPSTQWLREV